VSRVIYGIFREQALSPGKVAEDAAILESVLQRLEARSWETRRLPAEVLPEEPPEARGVLHMAQGPAAVARLAAWEKKGLRLINSPQALQRCSRKNLYAWLGGRDFPFPRTRYFSLAEAEVDWSGEFPGPGWLKRADIHAEGPGDVVRVSDPAQAQKVLADFARRHIQGLIWQEHVTGEELKFYAVGLGAFFKAFLAGSGAEVTEALAAALKDLAALLASVSRLEVFGGDAIVTPEGKPILIDLNDWPSFSRCREAAAQEIAYYVKEKFRL
jgi:glutathione synthase/RimK-type ligase-like ATP-grasp enzyme